MFRLVCLVSVLAISFWHPCKSYADMEIRPLAVAFTFSMPPYLSQDGSSGIERDIIVSSFIASGYKKVEIHNVHYMRAIELAKQNAIDVIVSNKSNSSYSLNLPSIVASNTTINYVDCAITLKKRTFKLNSIDDYYNKRIWAFKSASKVFGSEFELMTARNPSYSEDFDQLKQLDMLAMERIDIAISDRNIFSSKLRNGKKYEDLEFDFHPIGNTTPRVIRSTNKELIQKFNEGLKQLKENGSYQQILDSYSSQYSHNCD